MNKEFDFLIDIIKFALIFILGWIVFQEILGIDPWDMSNLEIVIIFSVLIFIIIVLLIILVKTLRGKDG